ncbi:hypothetical protein ES705_16472 [subsurface metagenome]
MAISAETMEDATISGRLNAPSFHSHPYFCSWSLGRARSGEYFLHRMASEVANEEFPGKRIQKENPSPD